MGCKGGAEIVVEIRAERSSPRIESGTNPVSVCVWNPAWTGSYHTDLSRFVLPISDPSALNCSQFVGFQDSTNLSKIEKVAENRDFDGKETLIVKRAISISKRVLG